VSTKGKSQVPLLLVPIFWHYQKLGCTALEPDSYIEFAFYMHCQTDYENIPTYLSALSDIAQDRGSGDLQTAVAKARSNGLYSIEDIGNAYATLGLDALVADGKSNELIAQVADLPDDVVVDSWRNKRGELVGQDAETVALQDALQLIAKVRRSLILSEAYESTRGVANVPPLTLEAAYKILDVPADVEDVLLLNVYSFGVCCSFV